MISRKRNLVIEGLHQRSILVDIFYKEDGRPKPVLIFAHGFKGFKDFAWFNQMADFFANLGYVFVKFNFSHNGTGLEQPDVFSDLEAFGRNTFTKELDDLGSVIDTLYSASGLINSTETDTQRLYLMGHSRGGGIVMLKAAEDTRVKKIITLASVHQFGRFFTDEMLNKWEKEGVMYVTNNRTGQEMPMYYSLVEDYLKHQDRLDIRMCLPKIQVPQLIIHGTADNTVPLEAAHEIHRLHPRSKLIMLPGADHVFGGTHPWKEEKLPADARKALEAAEQFLRRDLDLQLFLSPM